MEVSTPQFELAVVGGGPAGTSAAITAARAGLRVVLLESGDYPRHKVCGEFVSGEALTLLTSLVAEMSSSCEVLGDAPLIQEARLFFAGETLCTPISPPALSIPRFLLDGLLWESARNGGVYTRSRCEVLSIAGNGPFELQTASGPLTATAVILAAGRWSRFCDRANLPPGPKWLGVKAHFRERNPGVSTGLYFFRHGYCGVQPVAHGTVNVCAMVRSDCARTLQEVLQLHPVLKSRAAAWEPLMEPITTAPLLYRPPTPVNRKLLLVGDAAAFIDPFVGDGISIALRSGSLAANCLANMLRGRMPFPSAVELYQEQYHKQFATPLMNAALIRRLLDLPPLGLKLALRLMRLPGLRPFMVRKTRQV